MQRWIFIALIFTSGYMFNDIVNKLGYDLTTPVHAEVAEMDSYDLRTDYDFKKAVKYVVENNCSVSDGWVYGEYLNSTSLTCY